MLQKREISLAKQQHSLFQAYLKKEKIQVLRNLKSKIFPSTDCDDYNFLQTLGQGSYGKVVAAQNIHNKKFVAIKVIQKKLITKNLLNYLMSEIRILRSIKFEFLISLENYFTNNCYIFLVLPFVNGDSFFKFLRKVQRLEENVAVFFAGQVVLAIEYLHYMNIIFRDLKPENLLLDIQGYLKLIDFGFAKHINHNYTYSFCGTAEYIAPEILLNKGYNMSPDWWTFGILLYEMCDGKPPFVAKNELRLYEKILSGNIQWPTHFSSELKSLLQGLLQVDKTKRLGCMREKVEGIKYHTWFSSVDWIALWKKKILPPFTFSGSRINDEIEINSVKFSFLNCSNGVSNDIIGDLDVSV